MRLRITASISLAAIAEILAVVAPVVAGVAAVVTPIVLFMALVAAARAAVVAPAILREGTASHAQRERGGGEGHALGFAVHLKLLLRG
jgi:hypothetical protein